MASLNKVLLIGNLTKDPEIRYLPTGASVAELRVAISERFRNRQTNEMTERTCFVDVNVWEKQAELCGKYLSKGSPVFVEGRLQMDEWQAQDGSKRSRLRVRAQRVQFLAARRPDAAGEAGGEAEPPPAAGAAAPPPAGAPTETRGSEAETGGDDDNLPF
jgi:single-strand DNA-binding protein